MNYKGKNFHALFKKRQFFLDSALLAQKFNMENPEVLTPRLAPCHMRVNEHRYNCGSPYT